MLFRCLILMCLLLLTGGVSLAGADGRHPYNVDDLLKTETLGSVDFDPTGRRVLMAKSLPYEDMTDFARIPIAGAQYQNNLYIMTLGEAGSPRSLFKEKPDVGYWSPVFSPDGRHLIIYRQSSEAVDVGVYDFTSQKTIWLPYAPYYAALLPTRPVWISNEEFVFAAMPPGRMPITVTRKREVARRLFSEWEKAWQGELPTAHVLKSSSGGIDQAEDFKPGILVKVNAKTGRTTKISDGLFAGLQLSPDRHYLVALKTAGILQPNPDYPINGTSLSKNRLQLILIDLKSNNEQIIPCRQCDVFPNRVEWSADGNRLIFFAHKLRDPWSQGQFSQYETATGASGFIAHDGLDLSPVSSAGLMAAPDRAAWIGNRLAVFAKPILGLDGKLSNWASDAEQTDADGPLKLGRSDWFLIGPDGKRRNLTASFKSVSYNLLSVFGDAIYIFADGNVWRLGADGSRRNMTAGISQQLSFSELSFRDDVTSTSQTLNSEITLQASGDDGREVILLDLKKGSHIKIKSPSETSRLLAVSYESETAVFTEIKDGVTALYVVQSDDITVSNKTPVIEINRHLKNVLPLKTQKITYVYNNGEDREQLSSCMTLPPDWRQDKRYPLVIYEHLGVRGQCGFTISEAFNPHNINLLAAQGYIILYANNSPKLISSEEGNPMGNLSKLVLSAVDAAIDQGYADPDRIGVYGESDGGYPALLLLAGTDRFKAAVAGNSATNFTSFYGSKSLTERVVGADDELPPYLATMTMTESASSKISLQGARPWEDTEKYISISPLFIADKITTPVMLLHGDLDISSSDQFHEMFSALFRLRKEAVFVEYWGESHGTASPANIRDRWRRVIAWYDKYLKNDKAGKVTIEGQAQK